MSELLQVIPFQSEFYRFIQYEGAGGFRPQDKLNYFRLAQRIRDERGSWRKNSPQECFSSFEDIIDLERKIEENDVLDFMIQCIRLKLVDWRHDDFMYASTTSYEQLETLHEGLTWLGVESPDRFSFSYGQQFEILASRGPEFAPTWPQVKKALSLTDMVDLTNGIIYGAKIPDEELDQALRFILDRFLGLHLAFSDAGVVDGVAIILKMLLRRGASLYFYDEVMNEFSLEALLDYAIATSRTFPLGDFAPYICCPVAFRNHELSFDVLQVPLLSCLAARRIPAMNILKILPDDFLTFISAHRKLQSRFNYEGRFLRQEIDELTFGADLPFPEGVYGPPQLRAQSLTVLGMNMAPLDPPQP